MMAERLSSSNVPGLKALAPFFVSEELFLQKKNEEALSLLETVETDHPDFALHAANMFSAYDVLDQALSRYLALVDKHPDQRLIFANIAEVYLAKGMKEEALSYAKRSWETYQDDGLGQFVYAKMLALNERYQEAEGVLKIPYREVELPTEIKDLWTDIMLHCVREDLANGHFSYALDRSNHYLILYPKDSTFHDFKARSEEELQKAALDYQFQMPGVIGRGENMPLLIDPAPEGVQPEEE
jgi:tetratricopeptide (TPR) repeat protein